MKYVKFDLDSVHVLTEVNSTIFEYLYEYWAQLFKASLA